MTVLATLFLLCCAYAHVEALSGTRRPLLRIPRDVESTGSYMVVLHKDASEKKLQETETAVSKLADEGKVLVEVHTVSKAFSVKLSPISLELVRRMPDVDYVEEEGYAHGDQLPDAEWHLDRLDQLGPELDRNYHPIGDGTGVDVYILDSGINYDHEEFEYRAKYAGRDPYDEYNIASGFTHRLQRGSDCHGHGTHVASLCGGKTYGSAKNVRLYSVRVLGCANSAPWSVVIAGLDIVADRVLKSNRPSVVSMSLSGNRNFAMDDAVNKVVQQGIHVVVAAGNGRRNSCNISPANNGLVVTVGGTRRGDGLYLLGVGSNFGSCVDVFAPGERVNAADWRCANCSVVFSGTSMSTPLVSGLVAIKLSRQPMTTPANMKNQLIQESIKNAINFAGIPSSSFAASTPNRLVTIPGSCGFHNFVDGTGTFSSPNFPGLYPVNLDCRWEIGGNSYVMVVATITFVELEHFYDKLIVYDGCCGEKAKIIGNMTGSLRFINRTFNSTGNRLCIRLITDGTVGGRGFNGTYTNYYRGTNLKVPTAPRPVTAAGAVDVQSHLLIPPRQARSDMSNLMKAGYKLTWISSYRVGPDMIPYFDFVATNSSAIDTVAFVEISFAELNETIHVMEQRKYYVSLLIDRIRGKNPLEPSYSVIFTRRDEIFETKVYLRDTLARYKLRLARKFRNGYRLLSQSFCSIRGNIEVSSVFIRDQRIRFNIPTPRYPQWRAAVNLTFFQFTDETLKEARRNFIPVAVEVYKLDGISQSLFSVVYEERTDRTEGNWFRWSLNSTAARAIIQQNIARSWDIFITTAYTYLGTTEHFIEFTRKQEFL